MTQQEPGAPTEDEQSPMPFEERVIWVHVAVFLATAIAYAVVVVPRALTQPIEDVSWEVPMIWAIGGAVVGTLVGSILTAIRSAVQLAARGRELQIERGADERDKAIERLGNHATYVVMGVAMFAVLVLAIVDADSFWIGNAVFVSGCIGAVAESLVKLRAYRRGF